MPIKVNGTTITDVKVNGVSVNTVKAGTTTVFTRTTTPTQLQWQFVGSYSSEPDKYDALIYKYINGNYEQGIYLLNNSYPVGDYYEGFVVVIEDTQTGDYYVYVVVAT